jgi:hypothetical protein
MIDDSTTTVAFIPDPVVGPVLVHVFQKLSQMTTSDDSRADNSHIEPEDEDAE